MKVKVRKHKISFYAIDDDYKRLEQALEERASHSPSKYTRSTFFHEFLQTLPISTKRIRKRLRAVA